MTKQREPLGAVRRWVVGQWRVLLTFVLVAVGGMATVYGWAVASPSGATPDEDFHMGSIWCSTPEDGFCEVRTDASGAVTHWVPTEVAQASGCFSFDATASAACVDGLPDTTSLTLRVNDGLYPGGYYDVMHLFVGQDVYSSIVGMRVVNGGLALCLLGGIALLLSRANRRLMVYSILPVSVPMMIYLIASINPSGWAITGVLAAWFGMCAAAFATSVRRIVSASVLALVGAGMAAAARADAGAYVAVAAVAAIVLLFPHYRAKIVKAIVPVLAIVVGAIGFLMSGQSSAVGDGLADNPPGTGSLLLYNLLQLPRMLVDYSALWFALNWLDTGMPPMVWVPVLMVSLGLVFLGLAKLDIRKGLALGGLVFVYAALPMWVLQQSGVMMGAEVQSRYVLPLVPLVLCVALWRPKAGGVHRLSMPQTLFSFLALVVAHSTALHYQIRRFVTGYDVAAANLNYNVEWWHGAFSPMATWALGTIGFTMLAGLLFMVRRDDEVVAVATAVLEPAIVPGVAEDDPVEGKNL